MEAEGDKPTEDQTTDSSFRPIARISSEENLREQFQGKIVSSKKLNRFDSLDVESGKLPGDSGIRSKDVPLSVILRLAFQSIGIVYGDIGTSPLYVFPSVFPNGIQHEDDVVGALSLILYTLTLIPLIKYVFIVLRANDNGQGGTFALYSLICRHAKVGLIPNQEAEDRDVSTFHLKPSNHHTKWASNVKSGLENSHFAKLLMLFATMLGTSMVIGDGILTPCISVLSAVGGIKEAKSSMSQDTVVWISVAILVFLFSIQRFGTAKVGYCFAPILFVWFVCIAFIGLTNIIRYDPAILKAVNPWYIIQYFKRNKKDAWISLGGIILCTTGAEALFADLGHFTIRSIQISTCAVVYPALLLAYTGQASYLKMHSNDYADAFYKSVPGPVYWPVFVIAVLAAIIASQSLISGTFSIIQQSLSLGCFPRVKVVHTSAKYEGQVYVPEINYLLMVACIALTFGFKSTIKIGNAYGIAVVFVMTLTSSFLVLVMIMIWKTHILLILLYIAVIFSIELLFLSSVLYKFDQGGYLPLAFALVLMTVMYTWNSVYRKKYHYDQEHKISPEQVKAIVSRTEIYRIPGLAIFYSELVQGIPPIFKHYVENIPAIHSVLVFVTIKSLPISKVPFEERFLFRRIQPSDMNVYRCVVRYGYTDARNEKDSFEKILYERLSEFVKEDIMFSARVRDDKESTLEGEESFHGSVSDDRIKSEEAGSVWEREVEELDQAWEAGVVHLVGENEVIAKEGAGIRKRVLIDYVYCFLRRNLRAAEKVFDIPQKRLVKVGMTYEL